MQAMSRRGNSWAGRTFGVTLLAVVAGGFWLRAGAAATEPEAQTVRVRRATLDSTVSATGVIRPKVGAEIDVGSRVSGIVRSIPVKVGDPVLRGDLLAVIDPTELQAQRDQASADLALAEAQLAMARSEHERATALAADGIVAPSALDSAARDLEVARARVDLEHAQVSSADIQLGYTEIRAPIRGVIADVTTREGETDIGRISVGQEARFSVDTYPDAEFTARVTAINPKAELQNGVVNYIVRLEFDAQDDAFVLRPEMTAHVRLQVEQRVDVLTLPRRAIKREQGRQLVRVSRDGLWVDQQIVAGWRTDHEIEIRDGLAEGELVQINQE